MGAQAISEGTQTVRARIGDEIRTFEGVTDIVVPCPDQTPLYGFCGRDGYSKRCREKWRRNVRLRKSMGFARTGMRFGCYTYYVAFRLVGPPEYPVLGFENGSSVYVDEVLGWGDD